MLIGQRTNRDSQNKVGAYINELKNTKLNEMKNYK